MTNRGGAPKVFGIGLNKTGTTTLAECGRILGYRCTSCNRDLLEDVVRRRDFSRISKVVARFDLFEDWPWPLIYQELDQMFPGSKFILTTRTDERVWLKSLEAHALRTHPTRHCRKLAYGYNFPQRHEREHLEFYRRHNEAVRAYFAGRNEDFLEVCWELGDGFEKLCRFLGKEVPAVPLPHANRGTDARAPLGRVVINRFLSLVDPS